MAAQATAYYTLYSFKDDTDGSGPNGVALGENGALYGTTNMGGANTCSLNIFYRCGTVFRLTPGGGGTWTKTVLFNFNGGDGSLPSASWPGGSPGPKLTLGAKGTLYGVTQNGGSNDSFGGDYGGTVFEMVPPVIAGGTWTENVLYNFPESPQSPNSPLGGLLVASDGAVYGTALTNFVPPGGSISGGTVFRLRPPTEPGGTWTSNTLVNFANAGLGMLPGAGLVSSGGALYGTTSEDYPGNGCGMVYEVSPPSTEGGTWTSTAVYSFMGGPNDGCFPVSPLTVDAGGILYGTTFTGAGTAPCSYGSNLFPGCGTVFQLTPPATVGAAWTETVIYRFTGTNGDGAFPVAGVVLGKNGVLFGTTTFGGAATSGSPCMSQGATGCGTVFKLTPPSVPGGAWTETILHSFTGQNGEGSIPGPLTLGPTGVLYGPTWAGGTSGNGTIFAVVP